MVSPRPHRVIVVGGGFGGLQAATHLTTAPVELTLVDRRNFHLFQPLTYQVATGALSPGEVCYPLRAIFRRHQNVRVVLGEVGGFDLDRRRLDVLPVVGEGVTRSLEYDTLIVAGGSRFSYFGHAEWRVAAPEVKSLESALAVRARLLAAFEAAELDDDEARRRAWLTFVVVGAGPPGVEIAGQIAELARDTLRRDFRSIDPRHARVLLVEAADRVLTAFPPSLSRRAARPLPPALPSVVLPAPPPPARAPGRHAGARAHGRRRRRAGRHRRGCRRRAGALRGPHRDLGGRGHRVGTGAPPRRADRRRARPGGPHRRRARPHAARAPGGARARRHGPRPRRPGRAAGPPRRGARRHAAGPVRRRAHPRPAGRPAEPAVPLPRQGQPRNHRSRPRGGGPARGPPQRLPGVDHVARRPSLLPRRLPEPSARAHQLDVQLRDTRSRSAHHQLRGATSGSSTRWPVRRPPRLWILSVPSASTRSVKPTSPGPCAAGPASATTGRISSSTWGFSASTR